MYASHGANGGGHAGGSSGGGHGGIESTVPDVPGELVDEHQMHTLRDLVARLCRLKHSRFPGAQPVSFTRNSLSMLKEEDYWVCEKSDGQRVLLLIVFNKALGSQEVYLIDRKNNYRQQHPSLFFPYHEIPVSDGACRSLEMSVLADKYGVRKDTLLDGELVWDTDKTGRRRMRLLLFDCIVLDGTSMADRPLSKRYGRLSQHVVPPFAHFMRSTPEAARDAPFEIKVKPMDLAYGITSVLKMRVPNLEHGNDGLIFTCINSGYVSGTDPKIIKWKPPSENTIDFKLRLRFPPDYAVDPRGNVPDFRAKPIFQLDEYVGGSEGYRYFDWLYVADEEWEEMKASGVQYDDRVVECGWHPDGGPVDGAINGKDGEGDDVTTSAAQPNGQKPRGAPAWRLFRIRDDKHDGNHSSIVQKILLSIQDGVEEDELLSQEADIRAAWKSAERTEFRKMLETAPSGAMAVAMAMRGATSSGGAAARHGSPPPMRGTPPTWFKRL